MTRAVGKAKAMEMCLTGRNMDAVEASRSGGVDRALTQTMKRSESGGAALRWTMMPTLQAAAAAAAAT
nr:enoyl-CoA hydratase-related protein [Nonomuraea deserti]